MSIGLGKSYQHVGLNRLGAYMAVSKTKGPPVQSEENENGVRRETEKPNEIWRRYTGIFPGVKLSLKQRKRGLRILACKISERVRRATQGTQPRAAASGGLDISLASDWEFESASWMRARHCGVTVEALCVELGCTRPILTALLKEHCGMPASEFLDGLKFSRLKSALSVRMREAAEALWGSPGSFVAVKLQREIERHGGESLLTDPDLTPRPPSLRGKGENGDRWANGKRSRFFRTSPEEMFAESRGEERERRVAELCAMLRCEFHLESWAVCCGYESGAKLKRACLNVLGRTLEQLERTLAAEVVQFYLCAEDRELREIALRNSGSVEVARAREIYHGSDEKPEEPFCDEYAKFEELKAEWLSRMWDAFAGSR